MRSFQLAKMEKIRDFNDDFFLIFWGHSSKTPILGMGYGAPPQTSPPIGALALHASRAQLGSFGPSIVRKREIFTPSS